AAPPAPAAPAARQTTRVAEAAARVTEGRAVAAIYVLGTFMNIMDATIVNVALPRLSRDFQVTTAEIQWLVVGYLVSLAIFIPASGWVGDRFGTKRTFLAALAVFTAASALCGISTSLPELVAFRIVQGAGAGMMIPVATAMLWRAYPPARRAGIARLLIIPTTVAPASGPILGGFFVDQLSWRWIFYVNIPVGLAALGLGLLLLREQRESEPGRFDLPGFLAAGGGLALFLYGVVQGPTDGWASPDVLAALAAGLALGATTVRIELRKPLPMLDLRLLRDRMFRRANVTMALGISGFIGALFVLPLFLQEARGLSALASGLTTFPEAIGVMLAAQVAGRLYPRLGPRRLIAGGLAAVTAGMVLLSLVSLGTGLWWVRVLIFEVGLGMGFVFMPLSAGTFATIAKRDTGRASALFNAQRQSAGALGVAILATVLTAGAAHGRVPSLGAFHDAFLGAGILAVLGAAAALRLRDVDAAPTMAPRA
ncbi:MAG: MDR family MFS transporter, partial [Acidimicrobiales bacterium]